MHADQAQETNQPQIDTDYHGSELIKSGSETEHSEPASRSAFSGSVFICVNLWLIWL